MTVNVIRHSGVLKCRLCQAHRATATEPITWIDGQTLVLVVLQFCAGICYAFGFDEHGSAGAGLSHHSPRHLTAAGVFHREAVTAVPLADKSIRQIIAIFPADKGAQLVLDLVLGVFDLLADFLQPRACGVEQLRVRANTAADFLVNLRQGGELIEPGIQKVPLLFWDLPAAIFLSPCSRVQ